MRSVHLRPELERSMFGFLSRKPACPPIIKMWEIGNRESMLAVVKWMVKNETDFGSILCNPVASYLYDNHLRPSVGELTNPETAFGRIPHFLTWVILKSLLLHDKHLKNGSAAEWNEIIEMYTEAYQEAKYSFETSCKELNITPEDLIVTIPSCFGVQDMHTRNFFAIINYYAILGELKIHQFYYGRLFDNQK